MSHAISCIFFCLTDELPLSTFQSNRVHVLLSVTVAAITSRYCLPQNHFHCVLLSNPASACGCLLAHRAKVASRQTTLLDLEIIV